MNILVTGGTGFIGSRLVEMLEARGDMVTVFSRSRGGDVTDVDALHATARGCEAIVHLAGAIAPDALGEKEEEAARSERAGIKNVCDVAVACGIRTVLFASSSAVYGHEYQEIDVTEDVPVHPLTPLSLAKREGELMFETLSATHGIATVSLRFFNVYGPRQDARMVIPRFFASALKNKPIVLYSDGSQVRDFIFIDDAVKVMLTLLTSSHGAQILNVASGTGTTINDLATSIIALTGSSSSLEMRPLPPERTTLEVHRRVGSIKKLESLTGAPPEISLKTGLEAVQTFLQKQGGMR